MRSLKVYYNNNGSKYKINFLEASDNNTTNNDMNLVLLVLRKQNQKLREDYILYFDKGTWDKFILA